MMRPVSFSPPFSKTMIGIVRAVVKGGAGIIHDTDKTVFVPGVIAGERVEFSLLGRHRSAWQGKLMRVLEASPQRIEPPCPHYHECGGCNLQHMAYPEQLRCKEDILTANLKKIAGIIRTESMAVLPSPPFRYRSKIELQVKDSAIGFFKKKSHQLVSISQCLLLSNAAERFVLELPPLPAGTNGVLQTLSNGSELAARLQNNEGDVHWLTPRRSLFFDFPPHRYQTGPEHFIQANLFQMQPMLELLTKYLPTNPCNSAADLFCGCGFFTLPLAQHFRQVLALENNVSNLVALRANLDLNQITNVEVKPADILRVDLPPLDLIVIDPPRGGLSPKTIARMVQAKPAAIIYFSCDSATFARDLCQFTGQGYELAELQLIDNFPQTDHFEIFSVLEKMKCI
jgi:23S rRNA (uracil1939-C5)-methyltransferase